MHQNHYSNSTSGSLPTRVFLIVQICVPFFGAFSGDPRAHIYTPTIIGPGSIYRPINGIHELAWHGETSD